MLANNVLEFSGSSILWNSKRVDLLTPNALAQLSEVLGPEEVCTPAGVKGTGYSAHWFSAGIVVTTRDKTGGVRALCVALDPVDGNPLPGHSVATSFSGEVVFDGIVLKVGSRESSVASRATSSLAGSYKFEGDGWTVWFDFVRSKNRFGKRAGARKLVAARIEVGGLQPFDPPAGTAR